MKSLIEYISESSNDLKKNLNILNKAIDDPQDPKKIVETIKKLVDSNKEYIIDAKDINSVERGMLIGYLPNKPFYIHANTKLAVFCPRNSSRYNKEWLTLHTVADENTESKFKPYFDIFSTTKQKLYPELFKEGWKVIHIKEEDSDILETMQWFI